MDARQKARYEARAAVIKAMGHPTRLFLVEELSRVPYLTQCVLSLSGDADFHQFQEMRGLLDPVRGRDGGAATVIWNQGPRIQGLIARLRDEARGGPFFLKMNMEAGHGGASGRFRSQTETVRIFAFLLDLAGRGE